MSGHMEFKCWKCGFEYESIELTPCPKCHWESMTTQPNPTAREMAEKCARHLKQCMGDSTAAQLREKDFAAMTEGILRELNLEELLRDRERLDWLNIHGDTAQLTDGSGSIAGIIVTGKSGNSIRSAIDSAISSQRKEGVK